MRRSDKTKIIFIIDLDTLDQDTKIHDQHGRVVANVLVALDRFGIEVKENVVDAIHFRGSGRGKKCRIISPVPCTFLERKLQFDDLVLNGGPYHFQEGTDLQVARFKAETPFVFKKSRLRAQGILVLTGATSLEECLITSPTMHLEKVHQMERVELHGVDDASVCQIHFLENGSVDSVLIETSQLTLSSEAGTATLKKVHASFDQVEFSGGHCQFLDSQLRDKAQTPEQIDRFQSGIATNQFGEWHRAQLTFYHRRHKPINQVASGARLTLLRSSFLVSSTFKKEQEASLCVEEQSVFATGWFDAVDQSVDENDQSIRFKQSLFVAESYEQLRGCAAFSGAQLNIANYMSAGDRAKLTVVDETTICVGKTLLIRNADYYHNRSQVVAKGFNAYGQNALVVIRDTEVKIPSERRAALKVDAVHIQCRGGLQNVIARANTWYVKGDLENDNAHIIVTDNLLTHPNSHVHGNLSVDTKALYLGGRVNLQKPSHLIARDQCIISDKGEITLRGQTIGRFGEFAHLGKLHVERDLTRVAPKFTAKRARLHTGSQITGDSLVADMDEVRLSGEIDLSERFKLVTKVGRLTGSIKTGTSIELAADYLLTNFGGQLNSRDVRIIGNYVSLLGEVQARRSYSRAGGIIVDTDLVLANNILTTALISVSLGMKLPNPNVTFDDLMAPSNLIRGGLTLLNLLTPQLAPLANAAYFASKLINMAPALVTMIENGSLEQLRQTRPHQWMQMLSYLGAMGMSGYQEFAHFSLDAEGTAPHLDLETAITRMIPAFLSGEMNNSLIILNGGLNVLPSSLNNALVVENAGLNVHINDTTTAIVSSHSGLDVADNRTETVDYQLVQGEVVSCIHNLFASHAHILPGGHEVVTDRAQWKVQDLQNDGTLTIESHNDDSVLQVHDFEGRGKSVLTGVTVSGYQFASDASAKERFHDVAFRDTIHIDNGHTSYTGYYVIQTTRYTHHGERDALDTKAETLFSLKSDDAEFQGVVRDNKAHIDVKNLKNVKDFLQGKGQYADFHVVTALELVTQQALELHGLDRDCDISISAKAVHFDEDVTFDHNVYIHSDTTETLDHNMRSDHYLYVEANGNIILENKHHTDPQTQQPEEVLDAKDGVTLKSDHGSIEGKGVDAEGKTIIVDADKDVHLDQRLPNMDDWHEAMRYLEQNELSHAKPGEMQSIIDKYAHRQPPQRASVLVSEGGSTYLHSAHGNITYNGTIHASDDLTIVADNGRIVGMGAFSAGDKAFIAADTGFDLLSERYFKQGRYGYHTAYVPSSITAGADGLTIHVAHGDATIDASDLHATGAVFVDANNINLLAQTSTYTINREHHSGFLGFNSHDSVTTSTEVFRDHITSDTDQIVFRAHGVLQTQGTDFQAQKGTYLMGEQGMRIWDVVGHTQTVTKDSSFWGLTYDKTTADQEFNVSTSIVDTTEAVLYSSDGNVTSMGTFLMAPNATAAGKNVYLYGRVLNNTWSEETRGLYGSAFGIPIFSSHTTHQPFQYSNPTWGYANAAAHSHGASESAINYANLGINVYNVGSALNSANPLKNVAQQEGITPSFGVGLQTTYQSGRYQTMGSGGFYSGNLSVSADNRVLFQGTPVVATHDAYIHAKQFDQVGTDLQAQSTYRSTDVSLGIATNWSFSGAHLSGSFSAQQAASQSSTWVNEQFTVGNTLHLDVDDWRMDGATTTTKKWDGEVKHKLSITTHTSVADSHSSAEQFDTTGNIGASVSQQHDETIGEAAGLHIQDDSVVKAKVIDLHGGKIISDQHLEVDANTINGESVKTHSKSDAFGGSTSLQSFGNHERDTKAPNHIDTTNLKDIGSRHDETQQSVIHGEAGTTIKAAHQHGHIDTTDSSGRAVDRDKHWDYEPNIPTGFEHGSHPTQQPHPTIPTTSSHPTHHPQHQIDDTDTRDNDTLTPNDAKGSIVATKKTDTKELPQQDPVDDFNPILAVNQMDFVEGSVDTFDRQRITLTGEDFENAATQQPSYRQRLSSVWSDPNLSYTNKVTYSGYYTFQHGYNYAASFMPSFNWDFNQWNPLNFDASLDFDLSEFGPPIPTDQNAQPHWGVPNPANQDTHVVDDSLLSDPYLMTGATTTYRGDKVTISYDDFQRQMPELMEDDQTVPTTQTIDPAYINALANPVEGLMIYDINRQAANSLFGRSVFSPMLDATQTTSDTASFLNRAPVSLLAMGQDLVDGFSLDAEAIDMLGNTLSNMAESVMWGVGHDPLGLVEGFGLKAIGSYLEPQITVANFFLRVAGKDSWVLPVSISITPNQQPGADLFNLSLMAMPIADLAGVTESVTQAALLTGRGLFVRPLSDEVMFHSRSSAGAAQGIIDSVVTDRLNPESRFGKGLYLSEIPDTTLAELSHHGAHGEFTIRYDFNAEQSFTLDLTNPEEARLWGYVGGEDYEIPQAIAEEAKQIGYMAIRFPSERGAGNNLVVLSHFDELLTPKMVVPAPEYGGVEGFSLAK